MVDISGLKVFTNKVDNYKSSDNISKSDTKKDSFKDYLNENLSSNNIKEKYVSKEVNNNDKKTVSNDDKKLTSVVDKAIKESDSLATYELASNIVEKIENLTSESSNEVEIDSVKVTELMALILALLNKLNDGNNDEASQVNEGNLNDSVDLLKIENPLDVFNKSSDKSLSDDLISLLSNDGENNSFKDNLSAINEILQNLIKAEESLTLNGINLELLDGKSLDLIKKDLVKEVKSLIDTIPKDTKNNVVESINQALSSEDTDSNVKAIFNSLLNKTIDKEDSIENVSKVDTKVDDIGNIKEVTAVDKSSEEESNDLNKGNTSNKDDISKKEERVLMKFLDDNSSIASTKNFNYYNKLNGLPSVTEEVNMPVTVNKQTLDMDIIKNVKFMIRDAISELKVKVYPKELGEMTIKILSEEGIMKAEIKATSKETYNLLNSNLNEIKKLLENQNIKIQEVNIGIYNEDTTFFSGEDTNQSQDFKSKQTEKVSGIASIDDEEVIEDSILENNLNILA